MLLTHLAGGSCCQGCSVCQQHAAQPGDEAGGLLRFGMEPLHQDLQQRDGVAYAQLRDTAVNNSVLLHCSSDTGSTGERMPCIREGTGTDRRSSLERKTHR